MASSSTDASRLEQLEARLGRLEQLEARVSQLERGAAASAQAGGSESQGPGEMEELRLAKERAAAAEEKAARALEAEQRLKEQVARVNVEKAGAEARASKAEARATAAEAAAATAAEEVKKVKAEMQRVRDSREQKQAECASLRATLKGLRQAGECPILNDLPADPVVASDGQTYDRQAIESWLHQDGSSPLTREPLQRQLFPNRFAADVFRQLEAAGLGSEASDEDESSASSQHSQDGTDPELIGLREAIEEGNEGAALSLLSEPQPRGLNDVVDDYTILDCAIQNHLSKVALAILARPDFTMVNGRDMSGYTSLHMAAEEGLTDVCRAILGRADFMESSAVDDNGKTAAHFARHAGHEALAAMLEAAQAAADPEPWALWSAIHGHQEAAAVNLLRRPQLPGLNAADEDGSTVLHRAILEGLPNVALAILGRADFTKVNATGQCGWTALHLAAHWGQLRVAQGILGREGFNKAWALNHSGETALQLARVGGHDALAALLETAP